MSLHVGHVPTSWKRAFIRPLLKRPIANLCEMSKITDFIVANDLLDPRQSGYRSGNSTQTALLRVCHDFRRAVDNPCVTILVLFDFSKAFDTVSHLKLLIKLRKLGFSDEALKWIFSYLTGRSQAVVNDSGGGSQWLENTSGVLHGSLLGSLLFSLFIRSMFKK